MSILDDIKSYTKSRIESEKKQVPQSVLEKKCSSLSKKDNKFLKALSCRGLSVIAEVKKASPSKGLIDPLFDYIKIAKEYERAGADAISCLTEPKWFLGSDSIFKELRNAVSLPMLRKEFIVDEYQLYQSHIMGADAVLLIAAICTDRELEHYKSIADSFKIDVLFEAHNRSEVERGLTLGFDIIGVNNRNLHDFSVDFNNASSLSSLIGSEKIFVAESGIMKAEDAKVALEIGADAILVGEALMRADDKKKLIQDFKNA